MMHSNELIPAPPTSPEPHAGHFQIAAAAYLARFKGTSRDHTDSDLRCHLGWCAERDLDPLAYNDIATWAYADLPKLFGPDATARSFVVKTVADLHNALAAPNDSLILVESVMDSYDASAAVINSSNRGAELRAARPATPRQTRSSGQRDHHHAKQPQPGEERAETGRRRSKHHQWATSMGINGPSNGPS
jgi:hypothetical protein